MDNVGKIFGGKIRVRVCGIDIKDDKILLVKHNMNNMPFYAPPGGAVEFGENLQSALIREFKEETSLIVEPGNQLFVTEYIKSPLHAIEIFFIVEKKEGILKKGEDPELGAEDIIDDVGYYSLSAIKQFPKVQLHHILHNCNNLRDILEFSGLVQTTPDIIK